MKKLLVFTLFSLVSFSSFGLVESVEGLPKVVIRSSSISSCQDETSELVKKLQEAGKVVVKKSGCIYSNSYDYISSLYFTP